MKKMKRNVEVNGPANIIMIIEARNGKLTEADIEAIKKNAESLVEYMKHLYNPSNIDWASINNKA